MPPSGYSITSTCAEIPVTCVKRPTSSVCVGIDTLMAFACWTWGLSSAVRLEGGMGSSLRVVDDQVAHLLALGEQIALEPVEEVLVQLLALMGLVLFFLGRVRGGRRAAGGGGLLCRRGGTRRGGRRAAGRGLEAERETR